MGQNPQPNFADTRIPPPGQGQQQWQQYWEQDAQQRQHQWQQGAPYQGQHQQAWQQQGWQQQGQPPYGQWQLRRGVAPWAWGALAYVPIPFFNVLIVGLVQWRTGVGERKFGGLAETNGRRAANWGLTQLAFFGLFFVVVGGIMGLMLGGAFGPPTPSGSYSMPRPAELLMMTAMFSYLAISVLQVIYLIIGLVQSLNSKEVKVPVIPFIKG